MEQQFRFNLSLISQWRMLLITRNKLNWVLLTWIKVLEQIALSYAEMISPTTDQILLCLTFLFLEYSILALRNWLMDSVLLPEDPQVSYSANRIYRILYRTACLHVKNQTDGLPVSLSTLQCETIFIWPKLFVNTHVQPWRLCSYPRYGLLSKPTRAFCCFCRPHPFFDRNI